MGNVQNTPVNTQLLVQLWGVSRPSVIWRNNYLIASFTDYLQMYSIRAKRKPLGVMTKGFIITLVNPSFNSPEETRKSEAFPQISHPSGTERRMGVGQRMREKKRASQAPPSWAWSQAWSGQPTRHTFFKRRTPKSWAGEGEQLQLASYVLRPGVRQ